MCDCLQQLAEKHSRENAQNGNNACVHVSISGTIQIVKFVIESNPYKERVVRRSKHRRYKGIELKYCPICGQKSEGHQFARIWH